MIHSLFRLLFGTSYRHFPRGVWYFLQWLFFKTHELNPCDQVETLTFIAPNPFLFHVFPFLLYHIAKVCLEFLQLPPSCHQAVFLLLSSEFSNLFSSFNWWFFPVVLFRASLSFLLVCCFFVSPFIKPGFLSPSLVGFG